MADKSAQNASVKSKYAVSVNNSKNNSKNTVRKSSTNGKTSGRAVGYLRVSTGEQELEKNKADILRLANNLDLGKVHFTEEKISGKISWHKRKIADILAELVRGDAIIVSELSRLGRSMLECMEILSVALEKGVKIYAVKGNWSLDDSIQSKIVAMAFSMASEIERDLISQRIKKLCATKRNKASNSADQSVRVNPNSTISAPKSKHFSKMAQLRNSLLKDTKRRKRQFQIGSKKTN